MSPITDKDTIHFVINRGVVFAVLVLAAAVTLALLGQKEFAIFLAGGIAGTSNNLFGMLAKTSSVPPPGSPGAPPLQTEITNGEDKSIPVTETPAAADETKAAAPLSPLVPVGTTVPPPSTLTGPPAAPAGALSETHDVPGI